MQIINFANGLDRYYSQIRINIWPELGPNCLTLIVENVIFFKKSGEDKNGKHAKLC